MSELDISRAQEPLWQWDRPPAADAAWSGLAGVAAPLIGGFSLAAVIALLTAAAPPPQVEAAVLFFCVAAVCLLLCVERTFSAARFSADPEQLLAMAPAARRDLGRLVELATRQRTYEMQSRQRMDQAIHLYNVGVTSVLLGILVVIIPDEVDTVSPWRLFALLSVLIAVVLELFVTVLTFCPKLQTFLPRSDPRIPSPPSPLPDDVAVVADEETRDSMLAQVEHARRCSWADLSVVDFENGLPASLFGVGLGEPVWADTRGKHVAALFLRDGKAVVVWRNVVFGCQDHVSERISSWRNLADPPEVLELIENFDALLEQERLNVSRE